MLSIKSIRDNKESYVSLLRIKHFDALDLFDEVIDIDNQRKINQQSIDKLLQKGKELANEIGNLFKLGEIDKAKILKEESISIKKEAKILQKEKLIIEKKIYDILVQIPNIPHSGVPVGKFEEDNIMIREGGKMPSLNENSLPHWDLANRYKLIDFELGNKITGAGFPVYTSRGAKLQRALIAFFLDKNIDAGYQEYMPPHIVNEDSVFGTGQLPDKDCQMYHLEEDNLYLIPTSEVPITNLFRDVIVTDLPIKCTSYTPCFRREAGSYGKDVRGLNRLHQFDKVEIVQIAEPNKSYETLEKMVKHVESILEELELPYRILKLCGGDLSFTSALTFDFEVYSAGQQKWLEVSSVSNFENYQANRLKLRYKDNDGKNKLCHTLNGSALALPRIFAALIENNQTDKKIYIPKALQPYTGFEFIK